LSKNILLWQLDYHKSLKKFFNCVSKIVPILESVLFFLLLLINLDRVLIVLVKKKAQLFNIVEYFSFVFGTSCKAIFVFQKVVFRKLFFKLFYIYLPLKKVVNGKHFPVNKKHFPVKGKYFPVNGKHFPVKEKFNLVSRKMFFLLTVFVLQKMVSEKITFQTFMCLFAIRKVSQRKTL